VLVFYTLLSRVSLDLNNANSLATVVLGPNLTTFWCVILSEPPSVPKTDVMHQFMFMQLSSEQ
jgi:hypothetical protein